MRRLLVSSLVLLAACASPAVLPSPYVRTPVTSVTRLALAPGSGALGEAVAARLTERGFYVMPADAVAAAMQASGVRVLGTPQLGALGFLAAQDIHAVLEVQGDAPGAEPIGARATVLRVPDGARIADMHWRNRFGWVERQAGRLDADSVARQLSEQIAARLRG